MEAAAQQPRPPPTQNRRLPNQTNQPTKTTPQGWCTLIRPEVVHFEVTGDTKDAERSPIAVISWGLEHIERIRKACVENKEQRFRIYKEFCFPLFSTIVAVFALGIGAYMQLAALKQQTVLKQYEVTFLAKQKGYAQLLEAMHRLFFDSTTNLHPNLPRELDEVQSAFFNTEPFLPDNRRRVVWDNVYDFMNFCTDASKKEIHTLQKADLDALLDKFIGLRDKIRTELDHDLFLKQ